MIKTNDSVKNNNSKSQIIKYIVFAQAVILLLVIIFLFFKLYKQDKIAYVDSAKLFAGYQGSKNVKKAMDIQTKKWKSNIDTLTNQVADDLKNYEKNISKMSDWEKKNKQTLINSRRKELIDYQKAVQSKANEEGAKSMQSVIADVNTVLLKYGKDHDYQIILIANQSGTIAYAREGLDITDKVLDILNKEYSQTNTIKQ